MYTRKQRAGCWLRKLVVFLLLIPGSFVPQYGGRMIYSIFDLSRPGKKFWSLLAMKTPPKASTAVRRREKSALIRDPGSELRLIIGRREKQRAKAMNGKGTRKQEQKRRIMLHVLHATPRLLVVYVCACVCIPHFVMCLRSILMQVRS